MKRIAYPSFLFSLVLFATFYAASRSALGHMKPVDLIWWACLGLLPAGLTLLLGGAYKHLDANALCHGAPLGGCLCVMLFALATSLEFTSATETSYFPCLQAVFAAVLARILFKQRLSGWTWCASFIAFAGMLLMIGVQVHASAWRGDLAAILAAFCYTVYIFLVDVYLIKTAMKRGRVIATVGVQFLTLTLGASIIELLFGNWPLAQLRWPNDGSIIYQRHYYHFNADFCDHAALPRCGYRFLFIRTGANLQLHNRLCHFGGNVFLRDVRWRRISDCQCAVPILD
ncbi:MAG TPA: DMT family transporter [Ktedonobacteraceae bacterium]|nr:DMT family transporter [Ktedonobacteraceae bacterium]